jgi:propanol-preferring alcohol dehydrogenase
MKAAILEKATDLKENQHPLRIVELPEPETADGEILVKVSACGVCHTELDEIEGRTPPSFFPIILGHQIVGTVAKQGKLARQFGLGQRVGIGWIHQACGRCSFCLSGNENLCGDFKATGRDAHGGYAEYMAVNENFAFAVPETFSDVQAAPLLCAGAIGYRSLRLSNLKDGQRLGLTGFGACAHLVLKMVRYRYPDTDIFVFARNKDERNFALELGAVWAGDTSEESPEKLHAIIDTTPAWKPVVSSLGNLEPAGRLVINAIRKEETDKDFLLRLNYSRDLWLEKEIKSVANVARSDIQEFLALAGDIPILPEVNEYALEDANRALLELKEGRIRGAKVLKIH